MVESMLKKLECFNDSNFKFDPSQHKYTYDGKTYTSVTQFIQQFHKKFDQEYWSKKKSEDRGISQEEILKEWKDKNEYANLVGSETHQWIEDYFNGIHKKIPTNLDIVDRINKFNIIYAKDIHKLTPLKFETRIFSKNYPIAGTIDSLFLYKNNLIIFDYKTNGKFTNDEHIDGRWENLLDPFQDIFRNHLNEYSIQVSLYSLILQEWGFDVRASYLLHIGPTEDPKIYKAHDFRNRLDTYMKNYNW
jgi:ATP-dependent exoDNAse (exonuclease V) beta subunit